MPNKYVGYVIKFFFFMFWTFFWIKGIIENYETYTPLSWTVVIITALLPYVIYFLLHQHKKYIENKKRKDDSYVSPFESETPTDHKNLNIAKPSFLENFLKVVVTVLFSTNILAFLISFSISRNKPPEDISGTTTALLGIAIVPFAVILYLIWRKPIGKKSKKKIAQEEKLARYEEEYRELRQQPNLKSRSVEQRQKTNTLKKSTTQLIFNLHPDFEELIWFADGPQANYDPDEPCEKINFTGLSAHLKLFLETHKENSAIYWSLPVHKPDDPESVPRPSYYPSYSSLTPEQRWMYLNFLSNPYGNHDVGYAFIFYYGLERHLLRGDFERAFDIIIKLRSVYSNKSFQSYSAYALVLSCVINEKIEKFEELCNHFFLFPDSFPFEIQLFMASIDGKGLSAKIIMKNATALGFTNKNYIKSDPELFEECLIKVFDFEFGQPTMPIYKTNYFHDVVGFANPCFITKSIEFPDFLSDEQFLRKSTECLQDAHDNVKKIKAQNRKTKVE